MLFSTNIFIYLFLPTVVIIYFLIKTTFEETLNIRNIILLMASLFFYYWGSGKLILIMFFLVFVNYISSLLMSNKNKNLVFVFCMILNVAIIFYFKYANFFYSVLSLTTIKFFGIQMQPLAKIALPIGISFYTFQAMSYVIDVYKGTVKPERNFIKLMLYISFFPQLIAGPIVRYQTVTESINTRKETYSDFYEGVCRFSFGLAKKVLLADTFGKISENILVLNSNELSSIVAWIGLAMYTMRIYFDFSGYSDMAIGMARMFGFKFIENFNLPYISQNITEFWRRWHISLSTWFRDYLYIPLGGNKKGEKRTYINLFIVFLLCGLWHGANYTFIVWGLYQGIFLVIERFLKKKFNFEMKGIIGRIVTIFLIMIGWVYFMSPSLTYANNYLGRLFGITQNVSFEYFSPMYYLQKSTVFFLVIAILLSCFSFQRVRGYIEGSNLKGILAVLCLFLSMAFMSKVSFTPFIYFQF